MASKNRKSPEVQQPAPSTVEPAGTMTVRPKLRRNPRAPVFFSPVVDVRITDRDIRLLSFTIPPADAEEVVVQDGELTLPIPSQCELVLPLETAAQLIQALSLQYESFLRKRRSERVEVKG